MLDYACQQNMYHIITKIPCCIVRIKASKKS